MLLHVTQQALSLHVITASSAESMRWLQEVKGQVGGGRRREQHITCHNVLAIKARHTGLYFGKTLNLYAFILM